MQNRILKSIMVLVCITGLSAAVSGQSIHLFEIEIPFEFVINDRTLPAGRYAVERIDSGKPNVLMIKNTAYGTTRIILVQRVEKETPSEASYLIFSRRAGKAYLFQVWTIGNNSGNQIPQRDGNKLLDQPAKSSSLVRVRAENP